MSENNIKNTHNWFVWFKNQRFTDWWMSSRDTWKGVFVFLIFRGLTDFDLQTLLNHKLSTFGNYSPCSFYYSKMTQIILITYVFGILSPCRDEKLFRSEIETTRNFSPPQNMISVVEMIRCEIEKSYLEELIKIRKKKINKLK